jgi:hypothetical protein
VTSRPIPSITPPSDAVLAAFGDLASPRFVFRRLPRTRLLKDPCVWPGPVT